MSRSRDPFEEMLHRYRGLLFTLCSQFRHRGLDTEDLMQEATIALWRNSERLLSLGRVQQAAFAWKVARNAAIDALRRTEETEELPDYYDAPWESPTAQLCVCNWKDTAMRRLANGWT